MAALLSAASQSASRIQTQPARRCAFKSSPPARAVRMTCAAQQQEAGGAGEVARRQALWGLAAALAAARIQPALAEEDGMATYYGLATPPTSYGGYGGNDPNASPKYKFDYPAGWKIDTINKVDKGTQGIDCRLYNPRNKQQQVFVITFGRAGEDNKSFKLTDIDSTIAGFAGADYDMQDALSLGEKETSVRDVDGQTFFDIQIDSPDVQYLSTVTVEQGKVYACFVKCPTRLFRADEARLRGIISSFRTLKVDSIMASP